VRGHHLLCAVCVRGGCKTPPPGKKALSRLLAAMWTYPYVPLKITADVDLKRAHYLDVFEGRNKKRLPKGFSRRSRDYVARRKDLEVCRALGIVPNTVMPAFHVYQILFSRLPTLDGICRTDSRPSGAWPECPHARRGFYESIAGGPRFDLRQQTELGEKMDGQGLWAMLRPRSRQDMLEAKKRSADFIMHKADRLYIRPAHCLCILCTASAQDPLIQDNLVELRKRMEENPDIPVTLVEGCCMVCDSCNEYHLGEHLCYHAHIKNDLRDLMMLERLGLPPGATLPAGKLFELIYRRIGSLKEICGWRDGSNTAPLWAPCAYDQPVLEEARRKGIIARRSTQCPIARIGSSH
jgi:hypothetical protein